VDRGTFHTVGLERWKLSRRVLRRCEPCRDYEPLSDVVKRMFRPTNVLRRGLIDTRHLEELRWPMAIRRLLGLNLRTAQAHFADNVSGVELSIIEPSPHRIELSPSTRQLP
jgi:hypothetical protein